MVATLRAHVRHKLVFHFILLDTQSIEAVPRILLINPETNPLCNNLLLAFIDRASRVFREAYCDDVVTRASNK